MKPLPIRVRLTVWYLGVVCLTYLLLSVGMYFGMRSAIQRSVDHNLRARMDEMQQFLLLHKASSESSMPNKFREASGVQPGEDFYQLTNASGSWLYQTPSMVALRVPAEAPDLSCAPHFYTILRPRRTSIRVLAATVRQSDRLYLVQVAEVVSSLNKVLLWFRFIAFWTLPAVLILAGAGGNWLSVRAMNPVRAITQAAQVISEQSLSKRLVLPVAQDELYHLTSTLNRMLLRLDKAFTRVAQFTADASHELRTPIAAIRTTSEVILERPRSVAEYEEMVGQILSEAEYTSDLVENLLTLARADANPASLDLSVVDVGQIVGEVVTTSRALAARKELTLSAEIPATPVAVLAEPQALKRVLLIFLDNAIRYTPVGGRVGVLLDIRQEGVVIEVSDNGIGIAEAELPRVFERFYRAASARDAEIEGSGLGLSIAKWIVDAHHGAIEVQSEIDNGTVFRLQLATLETASARGI